MNEQRQGDNYGILQPKPPQQVKVLTGTQIAVRLMIAVCVLVIAACAFWVVRNRYQKPLKTYYKALSKQDVDAMCDAFPTWLVNADVAEDSVTVRDMCLVMISSVRGNFGNNYDVDASLVEKTAVAEDYLLQLQDGIFQQYQTRVEVQEGWRVQLSVVYSYAENEVTMTEYARLYKINGQWYLLDVPGSEE